MPQIVGEAVRGFQEERRRVMILQCAMERAWRRWRRRRAKGRLFATAVVTLRAGGHRRVPTWIAQCEIAPGRRAEARREAGCPRRNAKRQAGSPRRSAERQAGSPRRSAEREGGLTAPRAR